MLSTFPTSSRSLAPFPRFSLFIGRTTLPTLPGDEGFGGGMANRHTIILMQTSQSRASRTFMCYDSISQAMDGICALYERKIKELNPNIRNITYDISDLYNFVDGLADLSALVFDNAIQAYLPYDRQWIKQRAFQHLRKLASY